MPQAVQCTESETCQKSIKCAVQSLWNSVIFSQSCLKVKCRSILGWPCLKVPWVFQLLPLSSSLVWGGFSGRKLTFFSGNKQSMTTKFAALAIINQGDERWKLVSYSKQQREFYTKQKLCLSGKQWPNVRTIWLPVITQTPQYSQDCVMCDLMLEQSILTAAPD